MQKLIILEHIKYGKYFYIKSTLFGRDILAALSQC